MRFPRRRFFLSVRSPGNGPRRSPVSPRGPLLLRVLPLAAGALVATAEPASAASAPRPAFSITAWPAGHPSHLGVALAGRQEVVQVTAEGGTVHDLAHWQVCALAPLRCEDSPAFIGPAKPWRASIPVPYPSGRTSTWLRGGQPTVLLHLRAALHAGFPTGSSSTLLSPVTTTVAEWLAWSSAPARHVPPPAVLSARAAPSQLGPGGGMVEGVGAVKGANVCRLAVLSDHGVKVTLPKPASCRPTFDPAAGYFRQVVLGPNPHVTPTTVELGLFPYGLVRKFTGVFYVTLAGRPRTVVTRLGTPVPQPASPEPSPPVAIPLVTTSVASTLSSSWSGYGLQGGPYTAVVGDFTVPRVSAACGQWVATWVGIGSFAGDTGLVQAGVSQTCGGQVIPWTYWFDRFAWPLPPVPEIAEWSDGQPATVRPGDRVQVSISQRSPGTWAVSLADLTTGGSYTTTVNWAGSPTSVEWIVEDPDQFPAAPCWRPAPLYRVCPLPDYGAVRFSGLGASPATGSWAEDIMVNQSGGPVSVPGPLSSSGFDVAYVASPEPGPPVAVPTPGGQP